MGGYCYFQNLRGDIYYNLGIKVDSCNLSFLLDHVQDNELLDPSMNATWRISLINTEVQSWELKDTSKPY